MTRAAVGLGSNLSDPAEQVRMALTALAGIPQSTVLGESRLYGNPPLGPQDQPDYVNAVAILETGLDADTFFRHLRDIETAQGRVRNGERWGPRVIDLDLLLFGAQCIDSAQLTVPHPGVAERVFVLLPLVEIDPEIEIPGHGRAGDLLQKFDTSTLHPLGAAPALNAAGAATFEDGC